MGRLHARVIIWVSTASTCSDCPDRRRIKGPRTNSFTKCTLPKGKPETQYSKSNLLAETTSNEQYLRPRRRPSLRNPFSPGRQPLGKMQEKDKKKYAGQVLYSDIIGKDRKELHYWSLTLNRLQNRSVDTRKIRRLMVSTDQPRALHLDLTAAQLAQKRCKQRYKQHKLEDSKLRQDFQLRVNERRAIKFGTSVATQEKITKSAFKTKNTFARIRKVINKKPRADITYVKESDAFRITVECFQRTKIDEACIFEGKKRYSQSHSTPFLNTPLLEDFGFLVTKITLTPSSPEPTHAPKKSTHSPKHLFRNYNDNPN
jgi:hypothetical protein